MEYPQDMVFLFAMEFSQRRCSILFDGHVRFDMGRSSIHFHVEQCGFTDITHCVVSMHKLMSVLEQWIKCQHDSDSNGLSLCQELVYFYDTREYRRKLEKKLRTNGIYY